MFFSTLPASETNGDFPAAKHSLPFLHKYVPCAKNKKDRLACPLFTPCPLLILICRRRPRLEHTKFRNQVQELFSSSGRRVPQFRGSAANIFHLAMSMSSQCHPICDLPIYHRNIHRRIRFTKRQIIICSARENAKSIFARSVTNKPLVRKRGQSWRNPAHIFRAIDSMMGCLSPQRITLLHFQPVFSPVFSHEKETMSKDYPTSFIISGQRYAHHLTTITPRRPHLSIEDLHPGTTLLLWAIHLLPLITWVLILSSPASHARLHLENRGPGCPCNKNNYPHRYASSTEREARDYDYGELHGKVEKITQPRKSPCRQNTHPERYRLLCALLTTSGRNSQVLLHFATLLLHRQVPPSVSTSQNVKIPTH